MNKPNPDLGQQVDQCYREAIADWLKGQRAFGDKDGHLAREVRCVDLAVKLRPSRAGLIVVSLTASRRFNDACYPFPLQLTPYQAFFSTTTD